MMEMRRLSFWDHLVMAVRPAKRREYEKRLLSGIRWLVDHPQEPFKLQGDVQTSADYDSKGFLSGFELPEWLGSSTKKPSAKPTDKAGPENEP